MNKKTQNHHYNPKLKTFARSLRNNSTKAEIVIWKELLRAKKMQGYSFLRQRPILNYIADFYCKKLKLIIEIDGFTHDDQETLSRDQIRDKNLQAVGYNIVRFTDYEVRNELIAVKNHLESYIEQLEREMS